MIVHFIAFISFHAASATLAPVARHSICQGDAIAYNCTILSGDQDLYLTWLVTYVGLPTVDIMHTGRLREDVVIENERMSFRTTLNVYERGKCIDSTISFNNKRRNEANGASVECRMGNARDVDTIMLSFSICKHDDGYCIIQ